MPTLGENPQRMGHAPPADGNDRRVAHMWNSKVNLKSKSLGCPHLAIFEKWGPTISTTHDARDFGEGFYTLSGVQGLQTPGKLGQPPGLNGWILSRALLRGDGTNWPSAVPWRPCSGA